MSGFSLAKQDQQLQILEFECTILHLISAGRP